MTLRFFLRHTGLLTGALVTSLLVGSAARASDDDEARKAFLLGSERVKEARWAEALEAYERSAKLKPHAVTTFNVGVCERALGHGTRAEKAFAEALADDRRESIMPEPVRRDAEAFLGETRATLAELDVTLDPPDATLLVDGRPLVTLARTERGVVTVAGLAAPGPAQVAPAAQFRLRLDPGAHVLLLGHAGFADVVRREAVGPGARSELRLSLTRLPGKLSVTSVPEGGVVTLDGLDVGETPVTVERTAGAHRVRVRKKGFLPYEVDANLGAGQTTSLDAKLRGEEPSVFTRFWFWGGVTAVVGGAALMTYFAARPAPEQPAPNGGGLGWVLRVP